MLTNFIFVRDPQTTKTDAELIEALKRAWLLPREGTADAAAEAKFSLDAPVNDEGTLPLQTISFVALADWSLKARTTVLARSNFLRSVGHLSRTVGSLYL